jgi:undecaprenyl phosphate N,N'-diacetylbacillosamine 1-phosphate transferase
MYKQAIKRIIDILISLTLSPIFFLLFIILAPIIFIEDRGTVFFKSSRVGKKGNLFIMYKFRTMRMNAPDIRVTDGSTYNSVSDIRMTKVGKFLRKLSIDEIPQIINILKGDMSLIGPRPDLPEALSIYSMDQKTKLNVRPGITGYNQAYFRNSTSFQEKVKNDVYYVDNLTFLLDLKILFKTIHTVIFRKNIYNSRKEKTND